MHSGDGRLHVFNFDGEEAFGATVVGEPLGWSTPRIDEDGNIYVSAYEGGVHRVDYRGELRRGYFRSRQKFDCTGLIRQGRLHLGAEDGFVYALELESRRARNQWDHWEGRGKTDWFINSALAKTSRPWLIVASRDQFLYAFDFDGVCKWKLPVAGQMLGSPVVGADDRVLVTASQVQRGRRDRGRLICVEADGSAVAWEYHARGAVESTPAVDESGVIYFGDNAGYLHAVDPHGNCLWTLALPAAIRSTCEIPLKGQVACGCDSGALYGIKT